ncbi:MAG: flavodoxin family protein [Clostridiales bacterium]|nr:flavodoxin family protein [Clostridiales bacterium]
MNKLIIHDLGDDRDEYLGNIFAAETDKVNYVSESGDIYICTGCFGCWVRTPGKCVNIDGYHDMSERLRDADELIIVSQCVYGGFSSFVKNVMDRSIGYMHPYFEKRKGGMHHKMRYKKVLDTSVYFYGDINEREMETGRKYIDAVGVNFNFKIKGVHFSKDANGISKESEVQTK